jgi:hypothetical protein
MGGTLLCVAHSSTFSARISYASPRALPSLPPPAAQSLSIIVSSVSSHEGQQFLFSSDNLNNLIDVEFDFNDEEVLGFYISFLKAISLR